MLHKWRFVLAALVVPVSGSYAGSAGPSFSLAIRWLVDEARKRPNSAYHTFGEKLAAEMMDALRNEGGSINKKITMHRLAESNKAFSHFRW